MGETIEDPATSAQQECWSAEPGEVPPTGHPVVDEVLESLAELSGRPVDEHVAVFESAHSQLRGVLADAGGQSSDA